MKGVFDGLKPYSDNSASKNSGAQEAGEDSFVAGDWDGDGDAVGFAEALPLRLFDVVGLTSTLSWVALNEA